MKQYDIIIIGGGVTGTAIARELSKYNQHATNKQHVRAAYMRPLRIALLEKEQELAFGVSKSNSGIIHPGTQTPSTSLKGRLCVEGNRLVRILAEELGVDFKEVGELIVAFNKEDIPRLIEMKDEAEKLGVPGLEIVDNNWLSEHEPNLNKDIVAALWAPTAGIISPYRLAYDMAENAAMNGVKIHASTKVENIVHTRDKKNSFEIITNAGSFKTKYIINAAGLYADDISAMVGITDFKITPRKGEEFLLDKKLEYLTNHLIFPLPSKNSKGTLVIKTSDGNPMIGPTAREIEDKTDLSTSDEGLREVLNFVKKLVPSITGNDIIAYFAGLRPVAGHDFIIRHEEQAPGFINVAGIQSPGLTAAPAIAVYVTELLKKTGLVLEKKKRFIKNRKKTEHLFASSAKKTNKLIQKDPAFGDIVCRCEMVSAKEITEAIDRGAMTMDGIKFRTRAQAGRCHGSFCTTRIMKLLAEKTAQDITEITKRGPGSELIKGTRTPTTENKD
jgi:glycerol-3-phosphate dehydrogenase